MDRDFLGACRRCARRVKINPKSIRHILMSLISLVIAFVLLTSMSFSWFTNKTSTFNANTFTLDCGKGLRVNDSGTSQLNFSQVDKNLIPASSVDGRNLYFPTDGSDFSSDTENMTFRSANAGDKNQNYIQIDFTLTAQQNHTALYINDEKTSIQVRNSDPVTEYSIAQAAPLRSALWASTAESGVPNTPIVFNPTSSTVRTAAVADVDRSTGAFISSGRQIAHSFSEYSFGGTPVATLSKGVETKFSYIIWLEGTDPKCTDRITAKDIKIELAFTTSWDKTQTIRFEDGISGTPIKTLLTRHATSSDPDNYTLTLRYYEVNDQNQQSSSYTDFTMYKYTDASDNKVWSCNIPGDMRKNIYFILRPPASSQDETTYSFAIDTSGNSTVDRGANRLYVADDLTSQTVNNLTYNCHGHWVAVGDSDGSGHDSGGGFEGDDF